MQDNIDCYVNNKFETLNKLYETYKYECDILYDTMFDIVIDKLLKINNDLSLNDYNILDIVFVDEYSVCKCKIDLNIKCKKIHVFQFLVDGEGCKSNEYNHCKDKNVMNILRRLSNSNTRIEKCDIIRLHLK